MDTNMVISKIVKESEEQYFSEKTGYGFANMDSIVEENLNKYIRRNKVEFTDEEYNRILRLSNDIIDLRSLDEDIAEFQEVQSYGSLSILGMSERDFL